MQNLRNYFIMPTDVFSCIEQVRDTYVILNDSRWMNFICKHEKHGVQLIKNFHNLFDINNLYFTDCDNIPGYTELYVWDGEGWTNV